MLKENFARLYRLEANKNVKVGDKGVWIDNKWHWVWDWSREPRGRVLGEAEELANFVEGININRDRTDK